MATVRDYKTSVKVEASITLLLNEEEARALCGIFGYSVEAFLKVFYEKMGRAYVEPHEKGVRSLHETIKGELFGPLEEVDDARKRVRAQLQR